MLKKFGGMHAMQLPGTDHNQGSFNKYPDIFEIGDFFAVFSALVEETDRWQTSKIKKKQRCCPAACSLTVHNPLFFCSKIVMEYINVTFSLVKKIKMLGMLLNYVHLEAHKKI